MKIYISFLNVNSCLIVGFLLSSENLLAFVLQHTTLQQFIIYAERLGGLNNSLKKCALSQGKSESAESGNFSHKCLERNDSRTETNAEFKRYSLESPGSYYVFKKFRKLCLNSTTANSGIRCHDINRYNPNGRK